MPKLVFDAVAALAFGIAAWISWWFVYMLGFAATGAEAVLVAVMGVPIAACVSLVLGFSRGAEASVPAMCLGWAVSTLMTPAVVTLANPANNSSAGRIASTLLLAGVILMGGLGIAAGKIYSRGRNRKLVAALSVATAAMTGGIAAALILWK